MSKLSEFQKEVGVWGDETFNKKRSVNVWDNTTGIINHLQKEFYELKEACKNKNTGKGIIPEEAADCFIILIHLAHLHDFDLMKWAEKKMVVNRKRKWGKPDKFGVIEHV